MFFSNNIVVIHWCWLIASSSSFKLMKITQTARLHMTKLYGTKSENIDLFAAGDIQTPLVPLPRESISVVSTELSAQAVPKGRSSDIEEAESLRLEAEKETISVEILRIQKEKVKLERIDQFLSRLLEVSPDYDQLVNANKQLMSKEMVFRLIELSNNAEDAESKESILNKLDYLMASILKVDPSLHAEIVSGYRKDLTQELNAAKKQQQQRVEGDLVGGGLNASDFKQVLNRWYQQIAADSGGSAELEGVNITGITESFGNGATGIDQLDVKFIDNMLNDTTTNMMKTMMLPFLPPSLLPLLMRTPEIDRADEAIITNAVFSDLLTNVSTTYLGRVMLVRGTAPQAPDEAETAAATALVSDVYRRALNRINLVPGLRDRVRLFLLPDYAAGRPNPFVSPQENEARLNKSGVMREYYSGTPFEPVFAVFPRSLSPAGSSGGNSVGLELGFGLLTWLVTIVATLFYSADVTTLNSKFVQLALTGNDNVAVSVLTITGGIIGLQVAHEMGHLVAALVNKAKISIPFLLPSLQIGMFGAITNFKDFPKSRNELFDVAISGPVFGFAASLAALVLGLTLTQTATPEALDYFPALPMSFFDSSLLLHNLVDSFIHFSSQTQPRPTMPADFQGSTQTQAALLYLHPLAAAGVVGLLTNAFNCLPIGRLDGGRAVMAIFGRQSAQSVSFAALLSQAIGLLSGDNSLSLFWLLTVVFLQRGQDVPPEDDVTPLGLAEQDGGAEAAMIARLAAFVFCALLATGVLLPVPVDSSTVGVLQALPPSITQPFGGGFSV